MNSHTHRLVNSLVIGTVLGFFTAFYVVFVR
jgi:hypothetical protein